MNEMDIDECPFEQKQSKLAAKKNGQGLLFFKNNSNNNKVNKNLSRERERERERKLLIL